MDKDLEKDIMLSAVSTLEEVLSQEEMEDLKQRIDIL